MLQQLETRAGNSGKTAEPSIQTAPAIEARGLVKTFGDTRAVDGIDLCVPKGCVYGLLGPNGAGKTTTINILATLLKADGGNARIFNYDVGREAQIVRQLIGVTGQYASVDEKLSATENMVIFGKLLGLSGSEARKKSAQLLEEFGLADVARRTLDKFSGGMRRKLDLAASLIVQPPLLFLDEPTTGLDPRTRSQMWDKIKKLVASGSTILLTTQYLDEADQLSDRIAVIDRGRVVAEGTPGELKAAVGLAALHLQLADKTNTTQAMDIINNVLGVTASMPEPALITAPMADPERITDLLLGFRQANIRLTQVSVDEPTLDEVFLAITGEPSREEKEAAK